MNYPAVLRRTRNGWLATVAVTMAMAMAMSMAMALIGLSALPASAHGTLDRSEPPNGGVVTEGRSTLTLWFSEPIRQEASLFDLHTLDGVRTVITVSTVEADGGAFVEISTGELLKTTYVLDWTVLSTLDGHIAKGSVIFGVGKSPVVVGRDADGLPRPLPFAVKWAGLAALLMAIGSLAVSGRVLEAAGKFGRTVAVRTLRWGTYAALLATTVGAVTPFLLVPRSNNSLGTWGNTAWSTLTGTAWGRGWLAREVGLIVLCATLWSLASHGRRPTIIRLGWLTIGSLALVEGWLGHASTLTRQPSLAIAASASHLVAAGVWGGGLTLLVLGLGPTMRRYSDSRGPLLSTAWRAFSPIAAGATVVLVASGLYESGRYIPGLPEMSSTVYGNTVTTKIVLVAVALLLAGANTLLIHPSLSERFGKSFRRPTGWAPIKLRTFTYVVAAEVVVILVAVGAATVLTSVPTARDIQAAAAETTPQSMNIDGLFVTFEAVSAGPDHSRLIVRTRSIKKPDPGPITDVIVTVEPELQPIITTPLAAVEQGRYEAEVARVGAGKASVSVSLTRQPSSDTVANFMWSTPLAVSSTAGPFETATTTLAVVLVGAVSTVVMWRRRATSDPVLSDHQMVLGRQS